MKCPSCSANYASRDIACPYCGTPNPRGILWLQERNLAQEDLARARAALPALRRVALNRLLNLTLAVEVGLAVLMVLGAILVFFVMDTGLSARTFLQKDSLQQQIHQLYDQQRFGELYALLDEYDLFGEAYFEASQMALLYQDYENFRQDRMDYYADLACGEQDRNTLSSLIDSIHALLHPDIPAYPELTDSNAQICAAYAQEARAFAVTVLGLTEEELQLLMEEEYLWHDQAEALTESILQRRPKA